MNSQAASAMTTQTSPRFHAMSLPVSTLAANVIAARASKNTPRLTPASTAKAVNRDANPAYFPCRPSWMTGARGAAAKPPYPAGDELVEPDGLAADHVERIARDAAGGRGDDGAEVGLLDQRVDVDAVDDGIHIHPVHHGFHIDFPDHLIHIDEPARQARQEGSPGGT
jgi:hypothetical protein